MTTEVQEQVEQEQNQGTPEGASSGDVSDATSESAPSSDAPFIDLDQYGNHMVRVVVDGEEQTVPLSEATLGYQRTADYTRKTQALSADRERLSQAETLWNTLMSDPEGTVKQLQEALASEASEPQLPDDPTERRLAEFEAWKQQQETAQAEQQVRSDLAALHEQFGDFDESLVLQRALQLGGAPLRTAYLDWKFDWDNAQKSADEALRKQNEQGEQSREDAKRDASFVADGAGTNAGAAVPPSTGYNSVQDAARAAAAQLGINLEQ